VPSQRFSRYTFEEFFLRQPKHRRALLLHNAAEKIA
jgi:hypothetical protein